MNRLWESDSFINNNIPFTFNKDIIEYDMQEAGFSLTKEFKLLDKNTIEKLEKKGKDKRKIELGIIQRNDKDYREGLKLAFKEARRLFFEANNLEQQDILSIKKDAIFTLKTCKYREFGKYINFRPKNFYTSYIHLNKKMEFYYSPYKLDIKGLSKDNVELHEDYMIKFIKLFFKKMETETSETVIDFTKRFISKYKRKELEVGYYRTFDHNSCYYLNDGSGDVFGDYWEEEKDELDISYNFHTILIKLIQIPL